MPKLPKIVVTAALPYANGDIHIGHLLEYIQADIYTRFLKLVGRDAIYICASDMHGTPIEVNAQKAGEKPEEFALKFWKRHQKDFASYLIEFDNYYHTHSPENRKLAEYFYSRLKKKNYIYRKKISTIYCPECVRPLPDRYVKGTCPHCTTTGQYGDVCEKCSSALKGVDLVNPKCVICGKTPVLKESEHYFFKLSSFSGKLKKWMKDPKSMVQPELQNWLGNWIEKGLDDWCISRDGPYFGFEIPNSQKETGEIKYFYVWLDAPIGYISSTENYCSAKGGKWEDYWKKGQAYHFIGKDIAYFHFLFWPAMLMAVGIPLPKLTVHGFITVDGEKMSKSRGTFFTAEDFLKLYPAESLRFFYASHLDRSIVDINLNFDEFRNLNNNVLVGNLGNFCYRVLTFAGKNYRGVKEIAVEKSLSREVEALAKTVKASYQKQELKGAVKSILRMADLGNAYFQKAEVWKDPESRKSREAVGWCVNLARNLSILISPVLPEFSRKLQTALGGEKLSWDNLSFSWKGKFQKVDRLAEKIEKLPASRQFPLQMLVGKIIEVRDHPGADALYLMKVELGEKLGRKQVVAGLKKYYSPKELVNRRVVFVANIKPARLRGELSEAMVLAADDTENVVLLEAEKTPVGEKAVFEEMENSAKEITFDDFRKLVMTVREGKVIFEGKKLVTPVEDVLVHGIKEGARIC